MVCASRLAFGLCVVMLLAGCGGGGEPLPPGAPDPGRGEADPRPEPTEVAGCGDAVLHANPDDPAEPGHWPVGVRTVTVDGLTTEVWYPSVRGSHVGVRRVLYDLRQWLPPDEADKIPPEDNAWQICECYRDLPLDADRGPYPVVLFVHGTAGFRTQSLAFMVHWASRGFVVVAADHPNLFLGDLLEDPFGSIGQADLQGDVERLLAGIGGGAPEAAFLQGALDPNRVAMSGHSAGGGGIAGFGDRARVLVPMAAGGVQEGSALESTLVLAAMDDGVVPFDATLEGFEASPSPKRFLGIANAGHLVFSDLCAIRNADGQDIVSIAVEYDISNAMFASLLFDGCDPGQIEPAVGWQITNYATAAVLEETLHCRPDAAEPLEDIGNVFPLAEDYRADP
jgi:predicted dienelactone hydrolase